MIRTRDADAEKVERGKPSKMLTTRDINVILPDGAKKLERTTTKTIEVKYIDKDGPPEAPKGPMITTHNIEKMRKKPAKKKAPVKKVVVKKEAPKKEEAPEKSEGQRVIKRK